MEKKSDPRLYYVKSAIRSVINAQEDMKAVETKAMEQAAAGQPLHAALHMERYKAWLEDKVISLELQIDLVNV